MIELLVGSPASKTASQVLPQASTEKTENEEHGSPENATADTNFMSMLFQMIVAPIVEQTRKVVHVQPEVVEQKITEQVVSLGLPAIARDPELNDLTSMDTVLTPQTVEPQTASEPNPLSALVQTMTPTKSNGAVPESILAKLRHGQTTSVGLDFATKVDGIPANSQSVEKPQESGNEKIIVGNALNTADGTTNGRVGDGFPINWERIKSVEGNPQFVLQTNAETTRSLRAISEKFSPVNEFTLPFQSVERAHEVDNEKVVVPNTSDPADLTKSVRVKDNSPLDSKQLKSVESKPQLVRQPANAETTTALRVISEKFSPVIKVTLPFQSAESTHEVDSEKVVAPNTSDPADLTKSVRVKDNSPLVSEQSKSGEGNTQFARQPANAETTRALRAISEKFSPVNEIALPFRSVESTHEVDSEKVVAPNTSDPADLTKSVRVKDNSPLVSEQSKSGESKPQFVRQPTNAETTRALRAISEKFSPVNEIALPSRSVERMQEVDSEDAVVPNTSDPAGRTFSAISEKISSTKEITLPRQPVGRAQEVGEDEAVVSNTPEPAARTISARVRENPSLNLESAKSLNNDIQFVRQTNTVETAKALEVISEKISVAIPNTKQGQTGSATSDSIVEQSVPLPGIATTTDIAATDSTKVESNSARSAAPELVGDEQTMNIVSHSADSAQAPKPGAEAVAAKPLQFEQASISRNTRADVAEHIPATTKKEVVGGEYSESEKQETVQANPEVKSELGEEAGAKPDHAPKVLSQTSLHHEQRNEAAGKTVTFDVPQTQTQSKAEFSLPAQGAEKLSLPQQLPEDFARNLVIKISDELKIHIEGKSSEVRVFMKPESMGELSLRVSMDDGDLSARMDVSQPVVKAALEAQLPQLRDALARNGIDIQRFEIVSGGETQFQQSKEGTAFQQRSQSKRQTDVDVEEKPDNFRYLGYSTVEYII